MNEPDPYDTSVNVADVEGHLRTWALWSAAYRARTEYVRDLRYGPSDAETLDLVVPRAGAPLAVWFHGGWWRRLHKDDMTYVAEGLAPHGVATAIVNYGLAPAVPIEEIVAQARRAVAWLRMHAADYGADTSRIVVAGHSAGGQLAAMCAADAPVKAVVSVSGVHDLRPIARSFVNAWLELDELRAAASSPALLAPAAPCAVYATAGENERPAFLDQGRALVAAWGERGCTAAFAPSDGDDHFTICERLRDPDDPLTARIARHALG